MTVTGTFATPDQVRHAVDDLLAAGFPADQVSAVTAGGQPVAEIPGIVEVFEDLAGGVGLGALVAGAAGAAVAPVLLPGLGLLIAVGRFAVGGALLGGFLGTLIAAGHEEQAAADLVEQVRAGRFLVMVHTGTDMAAAKAVLEAAGAADVKVAALTGPGAAQARLVDQAR